MELIRDLENVIFFFEYIAALFGSLFQQCRLPHPDMLPPFSNHGPNPLKVTTLISVLNQDNKLADLSPLGVFSPRPIRNRGIYLFFG